MIQKQKEVIRKNRLSDEKFAERWRRELNEAGTLWEGRFAYTELRRKKAWTFLRCEQEWKNDWRCTDCMKRMVAALEDYRQEVDVWQTRGLLLRQELREDKRYFVKLQSQLTEKEECARMPALKLEFTRLRKEVGRSLHTLDAFEQRTLDTKFVHSPIGAWELLWPEQEYRHFVRRALELDTRLQVEVGKILGTFLRQYRITLTTICRLVLLAYLVAGLAELNPSNDKVQTLVTNRTLNVRKIQDNLIEEGIPQAEEWAWKGQQDASK